MAAESGPITTDTTITTGTTDTPVTDPTETSPKVKLPSYVGAALTLIAVIAAAVVTISPDVLAQLKAPVWLLPACLAVQTIVSRVIGYVAVDPARVQPVPDGTGTHRADE